MSYGRRKENTGTGKGVIKHMDKQGGVVLGKGAGI